MWRLTVGVLISTASTLLYFLLFSLFLCSFTESFFLFAFFFFFLSFSHLSLCAIKAKTTKSRVHWSRFATLLSFCLFLSIVFVFIIFSSRSHLVSFVDRFHSLLLCRDFFFLSLWIPIFFSHFFFQSSSSYSIRTIRWYNYLMLLKSSLHWFISIRTLK